MLKKFFGIILSASMLFTATAFAQSRDVQIEGDHGKLSATIQTPDNKNNFPIVIICHGFTGNKDSDLLKNLSDELENRGIASIRFDFNGHGKSEGNFQDMTVWNEIEDAKKVYDYAKNISGVNSISMAGHSQGGVVTSMVAGELGANKIKSIALMAPAAVLRDDAIRGILQGTTYNSIDVPEYVEVFGNHKVGRNYILTAQKLPIYETAKKFTGAAFMIHGTTDIIVPYTYSLRYHEIYKNSEVKLLDGFDHGFSQDTKQVAKFVAEYFAKQLK